MKDNHQQFVVVVQTVIFPVNFELSCFRNWIELVILVYLLVHVSVRSFMSSICSSTTQQYLMQYKTFVEAPNPLLNSETEVLLYMHACTLCVCDLLMWVMNSYVGVQRYKSATRTPWACGVVSDWSWMGETSTQTNEWQSPSRSELTLWRPLLSYGYSYKASCARPG